MLNENQLPSRAIRLRAKLDVSYIPQALSPCARSQYAENPFEATFREADNSLIWIASGLPTIGAEMEDAIYARVSRVPALVD